VSHGLPFVVPRYKKALRLLLLPEQEGPRGPRLFDGADTADHLG